MALPDKPLDNSANDNFIKEQQLKALLEEYKEMRNEIRSAYGQFFSLFFGIIMTGIFVTFYKAFEDEYLFLTVPYLIAAWLCICNIIRLNIQHIAKYICSVEYGIKQLTNGSTFTYKTEYAKKLWFTNRIYLIAAIPVSDVVDVCV